MTKIEILRVGMLGTNCYLVYDDEIKETLIVDPGDNANFISDQMKKLELKPVAIFLTHGHADHILAVNELREKYNIPVYVQEAEISTLEDGNLNLGQIKVTITDKDHVIKGQESINISGMKIEAFATPGHTPGGGCFYFPEASFVLSGDTMFRYSWGRTDFPGGNELLLMESIRTKLLPLPEETIVYPGHESATIIRDERKIHNYR